MHSLVTVMLAASLVFVLSGCQAQSPETRAEPSAGALASPAPPTEVPSGPDGEPAAGPDATPVMDGAISAEEYRHSASLREGVTVWWSNDAEYLYIAAEAPTTGWVAVGIAPEQRMMGANYVQAAVVEGVATVWDAYGTAPTGPTHPPDEDLGGTNDIVAYAVVEEAGTTRFEAQVPLDSGDEYDRPLDPGGEYPIIVAYGSNDDYNAHHDWRGRTTMVLDPAP